MTVNAREIALEMICNIIDKGAYANLETYRDLKKVQLAETDKRFALEITYGTVKHWNTLDWVIRSFLKRPVKKVDPFVFNVLRMGTYQLLYMDRVPASAACDESVKLVKKKKHQGAADFVNGVLRAVARKYSSIHDVSFPDINEQPVEHIGLKYSHPFWMVERWIRNFGTENTIDLCRYNNQPPVLSVRVNTLKISVEDFKELLVDKGIDWERGRLCPEALLIKEYGRVEQDDSLRGMYITQSEPSMLVSRILNPKRGEAVLDACSAPGSKTTHLAQLMENKGMILAVDIHESRTKLVKNNCRRLGVSCVKTLVSDSREIAKKTNQRFDAVLVDAPCSGTGVLNRRADARWRRKSTDIITLSRLQKEILESAASLLKPGGRLVYSTCSMEPEENSFVISAFLEKHPDFFLDNIEPGSLGLAGVNGSTGVQLFPYIHELDGFFICPLVKR